ncbi:hypothetical protein E1292_06075 [Nonomuraea deserti]|uniref:Outer membrane channel protein CpnT-like N-terminal domain-containing protein n=1 Tax=Nonomuraea deserti TaxID=1848322 RepID=A0A4R4W7W9_9ACTN|nr:hypothetical protein [Nonomuraea deserti]TDD11225.1 hypothetical protein E1292_06075 [Nonomuraea deserti]
MGLQLPDGQLAVVAAFLGAVFPDGDEDQVTAMGKVPDRHADRMQALLADGRAFARAVVSTNKGDAITAFDEHFGDPDNASANLQSAATGVRVVGLGLLVCAAIVLAHKAYTLYQYGLTAAALASAAGTGGTMLPLIREVGRRQLDRTTQAATAAVLG